MAVTTPPTHRARQLLAALAARDEPRLSRLITQAGSADLEATAPMSLFHAAAAAGDADAVRLLAEAGAPSAAAEQPANPLPEELGALGLDGTKWSTDASALAVAVCNGHTAVAAELLAAGMSPHIGAAGTRPGGTDSGSGAYCPAAAGSRRRCQDLLVLAGDGGCPGFARHGSAAGGCCPAAQLA